MGTKTGTELPLATENPLRSVAVIVAAAVDFAVYPKELCLTYACPERVKIGQKKKMVANRPIYVFNSEMMR